MSLENDLIVTVFRCRVVIVPESRCCGVFWSWDLDVMANVSRRPRFRF